MAWGGLKRFIGTSTHTSCYATVRSLALLHIHNATLLCVLLHFRTYVMLRYCVLVLLHLHTYAMLHFCTLSFTCTHTSCYAIMRSLALPYICLATLLCVPLRCHTSVMLRYCALFCTSAHTSCHAYCAFSGTSTHTSFYAAVRSLALPPICHATLLCVVLLFYTCVILRYCVSSMHFHTYVILRYCAFVLLHLHTYVMLRLHPYPLENEI